MKMRQIFALILCSLAFTPLSIGQKFCEDNNPLDTIFTLDMYTFATKKEGIYRALIGQPLQNTAYTFLGSIFNRAGRPKFDKVDTGFMITKTSECDSAHPNCEALKKLK